VLKTTRAHTRIPDADPAAFDARLRRLIALCVERSDGELNAGYLADESFYSQRAAYRSLLRARGRGGTRALELGAGIGLMSIALALSGWEVTGLDLYDDRSEALGRWSGVADRYEFLRRDLEEPSLGLEEAQFDAVLMIDVIEHVKNVRLVLENALAALKPGGVLVVTTPNYGRLNTRVRSLRSLVAPAWPIRLDDYMAEGEFTGHVREFTAPEMDEVFRRCGFDVVHLEYFAGARGDRAHTVASGRVAREFVRWSWKVQRLAGRLLPQVNSCFVIVGRKP
jgi:2-polyprenyl-3-methyl-5-hydroxy-6-metoxy-1,4-benzoquinol methylase